MIGVELMWMRVHSIMVGVILIRASGVIMDQRAHRI